jgi:predicted dienelactone hydrolase
MARFIRWVALALLVLSLSCTSEERAPLSDTASDSEQSSQVEPDSNDLDVLFEELDGAKPEEGDSEAELQSDAEEESDVPGDRVEDVAGEDDTESEVSDADVEEESLPEFAKKGPFQAGFRQLEVTYDLPGLEEPRTIAVGLWYPTNDTEGESIKWGGLLEEEDLYVNASLAASLDGNAYPVRAYTHGNMGLMGDSSNTSEFFASHGWVTVAPNHTQNTLLDHVDPRPPWLYYARAWDVTQALDTLENLVDTDPADPLAGKLNLEKVVLMGHSYGGYTGYGLVGASFDMEAIGSACAGGEGPLTGPCSPEQIAEFEKGVTDSRIVAYAPLDGGNPDMYGEDGVASVTLPMLQMYAIELETGAHKGSETFWNWLSEKEMVRVGIEGGCHIGFTLGYCPGITDEEGYKIIHAYLMAFSMHQILGVSSPEMKDLMTGVLSISEQAIYDATESATAYWNSLP